MTPQELYAKLEAAKGADTALDGALSDLVLDYDNYTKYLDAAIAFGKAFLGENIPWQRTIGGYWQWKNDDALRKEFVARHSTGNDCLSCCMAILKAYMETGKP